MSNKTTKNMHSCTANPRNLGPSRTGSTQKMSANIKVVVRVRPQNSKERESNYRTVVDVVDDKMLVFDPKEEHRPFFYQGVKQNNTNFLKRPNKELKFVFDHVFEQDCSNMDVFESSTKDMIEFVMKGYNCSVFAYGATGAGKTFTMIGSIAQPGITYLTMEHLFQEINSYQSEREFDIGVSYIEVYNENVYDLLKPSNSPLQLREDSKYGVMVAGLTLHNINTARELLNMLENGNKNRTQHPTDANAESSRSHAVFQVYIKMRYKTSGESRLVKLSMIDLAGSERASATGCVGERFKEGANINRSLLSLGNCINKLADGSAYIPYRDSKLTRLLKDSLGGNCRTVMIANVSPSSLTYEDTYNTLKYAARANKIQLSIKKNLVDSNVRISQYGKIIDELKNKVKELEAKLLLSTVKVKEEQDVIKEKSISEIRRRILESERSAGAAQSQLLSLQARRRMLALGNRLRRAHHASIALLTSRSADAYQQMFMDEASREVRSVDSYTKQMVQLNSLVDEAWECWRTARERLQKQLDTARTNAPALQDFLEAVTLRLDNRTHSVSTDLSLKLFTRLYQEQNLMMSYMEDLSKMLKKLFLTLKGYDKVPPALAEEYLNLTKKAKCLQSIKWSDQDKECDIGDPFLKFLSTLNLEKPTSLNGILEFDYFNKDVDMEIENESLSDLTCDFVIQNCNPLETERSQKRKCPKPIATDETIVIEDSFENTYESTPAKKAKSEMDIVNDQNVFNPIEPSDLNSTFVMAGKVEGAKEKPIGIRRELMDRTNLTGSVQRINSNRTDGGRIVKPVQVARVAAFKKPQPPPKAGFGSSLSRDGTPLHNSAQQKSALKNNIQRSVGFKLARPKERNQLHSYSRLANGPRR